MRAWPVAGGKPRRSCPFIHCHGAQPRRGTAAPCVSTGRATLKLGILFFAFPRVRRAMELVFAPVAFPIAGEVTKGNGRVCRAAHCFFPASGTHGPHPIAACRKDTLRRRGGGDGGGFTASAGASRGRARAKKQRQPDGRLGSHGTKGSDRQLRQVRYCG